MEKQQSKTVQYKAICDYCRGEGKQPIMRFPVSPEIRIHRNLIIEIKNKERKEAIEKFRKAGWLIQDRRDSVPLNERLCLCPKCNLQGGSNDKTREISAI